MKRVIKRFSRSQDGVAAVEFAIIANLLFALILAILDASMYLLSANQLQDATARASRWATINSVTDGSSIKTEIFKHLGKEYHENVTVNLKSSVLDGITHHQIVVKYKFDYVGFLNMFGDPVMIDARASFTTSN